MSDASVARIGRAAPLVAVLFTLVGITLVVSGVRLGGDDFTGRMVAAVLAIVAFGELVTTRFSVLPRMITAAAPGGPSADQSIEKVTASLTVLVSAFSVAPAIYGVFAGLFVDWWWLPIPFGAWGILIYAVCHSYLSEAVADLKRRRSIGS